MIKTIDITNGETEGIYNYLSSAITPRPIALVSTIDKNGNKNLSPFSFFNVFSVNPPIMVFAPVKSSKEGGNKHTLENVLEVKECVIGLVTEDTAQQVSLASCNYGKEINEFEQSGLTEVKSDLISCSRILESPINFECKVNDVIVLGKDGGAGNLVVAEILKIHINENVLDEYGNINPFKMNLVSRYGLNWYGKTTNDSLYEISKPISRIGMGVNNLPENIRKSEILTGSNLAILASAEEIPESITKQNKLTTVEKHIKAKELLEKGKFDEAWQILI